MVFFKRPFIWHCYFPPPPQKKTWCLHGRFPCVIHFGWYPWKFAWPTRKNQTWFLEGEIPPHPTPTTTRFQAIYKRKLYILYYLIMFFHTLGGFQPYSNKYSRIIQGEFNFMKNLQEHHFTTFKGDLASHHWPILLGSTQYLNQTFL